MASKDNEKFLGMRVENKKRRGTIRWVGKLSGQDVPNLKGDDKLWVGVEWDNPFQGKHDGTLNGSRVFDCPNEKIRHKAIRYNKRVSNFQHLNSLLSESRMAASILPVDKVIFGRALGDALVERYSVETKFQNSNGRNDTVDKSVTAENSCDSLMSELLVDKKCQTAIPQLVDLSDERVSNGRVPKDMVLHTVTGLNLQKNFIARSADLKELFVAFPRLTYMNISYSSILWEPRCTHFSAELRELCLDHCYMNWTMITTILTQIPQLKTLSITRNYLCCDEEFEQSLNTFHYGLEELNISENLFTSFTSILLLFRKFPNLRMLNARYALACPIDITESITYMVEKYGLILTNSILEKCRLLHSINIRSRGYSIFELYQLAIIFPNLSSAWIAPLSAAAPENTMNSVKQGQDRYTITPLERDRLTLIGFLPSLKEIDSINISKKYKTSAENYLSTSVKKKELRLFAMKINNLLSQVNPNYSYLPSYLDNSEEYSGKNERFHPLGNTIINVTLELMDYSTKSTIKCTIKRTIKRKFPRSIRLQDIYMVIYRNFKLTPDDVEINLAEVSFDKQESVAIEESIDNQDTPLNNCDPSQPCRLIVRPRHRSARNAHRPRVTII